MVLKMLSYPRIAITGGIATGKSTVADMLRHFGCAVIDADRIARNVVKPGTPCWYALYELLGQDMFFSDGSLRRMEIRKKIANDPNIRQQVNAITHPAITEAMENEWKHHIVDYPERIVIFDVPLLYESGREGEFSFVIVVYVPREIQITRLIARDGVSRKEAEKMVDMQLSIDEKARRANYVIDNSRSLEYTREQVDRMWGHLKAIWKPSS